MEKEGKLIYEELTYEILGALFEVQNQLGFGYQEKHYYKAIKSEFTRRKIKFTEQFPIVLLYKGETIGRFYIDFLVEEIIPIEIKQGNYFSKKNIEQAYQYLRANSWKLGLLVNFTKNGVRFRRILNIR